MLILDAFKRAAWIVAFAGLLLFIAVVAYQGVDTLGVAVAAAGWGLLWVSLFHLLPLLIDVFAWRLLLDRSRLASMADLAWMYWIAESINNLLPVAQIGGNLVRARLLGFAGVPLAASGASVVVHVMAGVVSLVLFSLLGVALLFDRALPGHSPGQLLPGLLLFSLAIYVFYVAQQRGLFLRLARAIERLTGGGRKQRLSAGAAALDRQVGEIYAHQREFWSACLIRLLAWLAGTGEVWLALHYLGHPVSLTEALLLESLGQAVRSAAFAVPGGLGVQEGGYLVLGVAIGVPPHIGVALSLVKRVRELLLGLPALLVWQWMEGRRRRIRRCA